MRTKKEIWDGTIVPVYPTVPHLTWLGASTDLRRSGDTDITPGVSPVLSPAIATEILKSHYLDIEEQLDGVCLAIYMDDLGRLQVKLRNQVIRSGRKSEYLGPFWEWLRTHENALRDVLFPDRVLYGEWCYTTHIVKYTRLPDYFIGFDIYEIDAARFWDTGDRDDLLKAAGIKYPHYITGGYFDDPDELAAFVGESDYNSRAAKGIIIRAASREDMEAERGVYAVRHPHFAKVSNGGMQPPYERNELSK